MSTLVKLYVSFELFNHVVHIPVYKPKSETRPEQQYMVYGLELKAAKFHNPPGTWMGGIRRATVSTNLAISDKYMIF
jgi:hypothetical protein